MDLLAQILTNGVFLGGLYAVMALGLALVWGVLNIVNLAHGAFIMLGAYVSWYLYTYAGIDPFLGLPITAAVMFALGYAVQRGILNLIVRAPMFNTLLITFGSCLPTWPSWRFQPTFAPSTQPMQATVSRWERWCCQCRVFWRSVLPLC